MNEINTLTLEIMQNTPICDIETAQEIAELVINKLDYHKEQSKISPEAIILARDLGTHTPFCDETDCEKCRYKEFQGLTEHEPACVMVKHAEALIALGWTKRELLGDTESKAEPINCPDCKFFKLLNSNHLYGMCSKTGFELAPFKTDTRTHTCQFAELRR